MPIVRRDRSLLTQWWWSIDRWLFAGLVILVMCGIFSSFAASPSVAIKLGLSSLFFVKRHIAVLFFSLFLMFGISFLSSRQIRYFALSIYTLSLLLLIVTLLFGMEIKGARRWLNFGGVSFQISEFAKPTFAVVSAWALSLKKISLSFGLLALTSSLIILQPDLGMTVVMVSIWVGQLFVLGLPLIVLGVLIGTGALGLLCAYLFLPHVTARIQQFFQGADPTGDMFQVLQSLRAFDQGGIWGKGPGEGIIKHHIPDVHADFVFSVIGEEFGFLVCVLVILLFFIIIARSLLQASSCTSLFFILGISGLIVQFSLQIFVNIASSLHIIPTKGMTLPFLSYGGSSCIAFGIGMGMLLAFTRKKHGVMDDL